MQLIYRAQIVEYTGPKSIGRPVRAVNWRYCLNGEQFEESSLPPVVSRPRVTNWRYGSFA